MRAKKEARLQIYLLKKKVFKNIFFQYTIEKRAMKCFAGLWYAKTY